MKSLFNLIISFTSNTNHQHYSFLGVYTNPRDLNAVKDNDAKLTCVYKNEAQTDVT